MDANSDHGYQPHQEEPPSLEPLGLQHPLLPPPALGQSFLQPHTLSPLGAVSLINLDTSLTGEKERGDSLHANFSAQGPTKVIGNHPSSHSPLSPSVGTQPPEAAQTKALTPKASVEGLQPQLESVSTHQEQPPTSNNADTIPSNAAHAPELEQSSTIETRSVLNDDQTLAAPPIQPTTKYQISSQSSIPRSEQAELLKQFDQDQIGPNDALQPKRVQVQELGSPTTKPQPQESANSLVPSLTENTPGLQTAPKMISEQPVAESKQQPEQTTQEFIAYPSSEAAAASTSSPSSDVQPLQAKLQDLQDINATSEPPTIQENSSNPQERATPPSSEIEPSNPNSPSLAKPKKSASSSTRDLGISTHVQPSLQTASSSNDNSIAPFIQQDQVDHNEKEPVLEAPSPSRQNPVISSKSQEQQVSAAQPTESQPASIQALLNTPIQNDEDVASALSKQETDITTDHPVSQTIESSPNSSGDLQTSNSLLGNSGTPNSPSKNNERQAEAITVQRADSFTAQQSSADKPQTPKEETNQTGSTDEPSLRENPPKTDGEPLQATTIRRADNLSTQASNKASTKKRKKKSQRKKISLQAQLSRMADRAKQDIDKVSIQLKQASQSLPIGKSTTKAKGSQGSNSGFPQTQPSNVPFSQATSSIDLEQSSLEQSLVQREKQVVEQASAPEPPTEQPLKEKSEGPNQQENSATAQAIPESEDSSIDHPFQTPVQAKSLINSDPMINRAKNPDSINDITEVTESISESSATEQHLIASASPVSKTDTLNLDQQKTASSSEFTSRAESSASQAKPKKRGRFPAQTLQRLTSFSKQVMDTVSRQLEPHPNEESIPLQRQKQSQSSNSEQISEDQRSNPISSPRAVAEGGQPTLGSGSKDSDEAATTSAHSDIQTKPLSPKTAIHSKSIFSSNEPEDPVDQADLHSQQTAEENLPKKELPSAQAAESKSLEPAPPHPDKVDSSATGSIGESSALEGHTPASFTKAESQPQSAQPRWKTIQTQVADGITNLGSQIKERVDQSLFQYQSRTSPQTAQIKEAGSVELTQPSEVVQTNASAQPLDSPESKEPNIQASAKPNLDRVNDNEQSLLTDPAQLTSTPNSATESHIYADADPIGTPSQEGGIENRGELTTHPSTQASSIDGVKAPKQQPNSERSDAALRLGNEDSIQRTQDSSELTSASSDQQMTSRSDRRSENLGTAIPESSYGRDRNLLHNSHISEIGTSIVQQLANLRPKKTKSKRKTKKQKPASSPAKISSENTVTDTAPSPASDTGQGKTSQPTDQPESSEVPTVQTQAPLDAESTATVQRQPSIGGEIDSIQRQATTNQQSSLIDSPDDPIKHSEVSTLSSSRPLPQTELPLQESQDSKEDLGTSDTTTSIADPVDPDSLLQLQTTQKQSPPDLPDSHTQNSLGQNALGIGSNSPERSPINEISIQTKVEQPSSNKLIQPQQQLPASSNPSVQQFSTREVQLPSESRQSTIREESDVDKKGGISETGLQASLEQDSSQKLDNTSDPPTQAASQNLDSIHTRASTRGEPEYSVQDDTSPTIQAKADPTVGIVSEQTSSPATSNTEVTSPTPENTDVTSPQTPDSLESASIPPEHSAPQAPSNSIEVSGNITETNGSIQRKIEVISDNDPPVVNATLSEANLRQEQVNTQPTDSVTPVQKTMPAKSESASEISNLVEKEASTAPIQAVEISVVQPMAELQPQYRDSTQLFSDRTQGSTSNTGDKLSTQPTPESKLPHPIDQTIQQQATPNVSPQTSVTADTALSIDLPEAAIEPDIQALTIEQSYLPHTASADVSEASEIPQPEHQPNIVAEATIDSKLPISPAINSDQATPASSTDPVVSDTNTSDPQKQLAAENLADSPPQSSDSIQPQLNTDNSGSTIPSTESPSSQLIEPTIQRQVQSGETHNSSTQEIEQVSTHSESTDSPTRRVIEITAQPPESGTSVESSPDLTVAQLLANGQAPPPLSNISDNLVSPKHLSSLLPHSKPSHKYQSQQLSGLQNINVPSDLVSNAGEAAGFGDNYGSGAEGAIAPSIQRSSSHSDQTLPSTWSSIEDLFTAQPQSPSVVQRKVKPHSPTPENTSDLVLTPTGIYPEKLVQRKTAPVQRTTQTLQKTSSTPPQVSSPPQTTEVVMRQSQTDNSTKSEIDEQSFEILAREIYHVLRQRLEVERERHGGYYSGRLPW